MRGIADTDILATFCTKFCKIVEQHTRYIIVSGYLAIASGRVRSTEDIDMILERITEQQYSKLHLDLLKNGFVCVQSDDPKELYNEYLMDKTSVRYTYKDTPLPEMEVKFAKDKLDDKQIDERVKIPLTGVDVWFSSIECNIAFKEAYLMSEKDLEDAEHLRLAYADQINEERIKNYKQLIKRYK
jgi:hypothetical protein